MKVSSIRRFLFTNVLLTIIIITLLSTIVNYYWDAAHLKTLLPESVYKHLGPQLLHNDFYILLISIPITSVLLWWIIRLSLEPLKKLTEEVAHRAPQNLETVYLKNSPCEIKPLVEELSLLFARLDEALKREKRFAANAAHELRTPIAAIQIQAQIALNTQNIHEKNHAIEQLLHSVHKSTHIIQQLLLLSQFQPHAQQQHDFSMLDLGILTREILALMTHLALEKNISLSLDYDTKTPLFWGNETAIGILIRNLVDNAIKYSNPNSAIMVFIHPQKKSIILEVHDEGPGIAKALRLRVFERFFRILGHKNPGSGLGLSMVHEICTMHHAKIELRHPKKGTGLVVKIRLPLKRKR